LIVRRHGRHARYRQAQTILDVEHAIAHAHFEARRRRREAELEAALAARHQEIMDEQEAARRAHTMVQEMKRLRAAGYEVGVMMTFEE
jgi:hypothetical protein